MAEAKSKNPGWNEMTREDKLVWISRTVQQVESTARKLQYRINLLRKEEDSNELFNYQKDLDIYLTATQLNYRSKLTVEETLDLLVKILADPTK